jgi:hypothetical protein
VTSNNTPDPLAYGPTGVPCGCGKDAHSNLVTCQPDPLTGQQLDDIDAWANSPLGPGVAAEQRLFASLVAEVRRLRTESERRTEDLAAADNPTPLRWGLNDVLWGDDDTVTVLLSGPGGEPYWLELDLERAAVLRQDLAGPPAEEQPAVAESETCGKCKQPFDPADTRFDGRGRYASTPWCRGGVDRCHDNESADHRCVICA